MKLQSIPIKLAYYVVNAFDVDNMVIKTETGLISVTRESVHHALGLPMGCEQISCLPGRGDEQWFGTWKTMISRNGTTITPTDLINMIISRPEADMLFVATFVMLVCSAFGTVNKQGACNLKLISFLSERSDLQRNRLVLICHYPS